MDIRFPKNIFRSARLKLTLFYLAVLIFFSLTITIGTRILAFNAYDNSDQAQRGAFRHLMHNLALYNPPSPQNDYGIDNIESQQEAVVKQDLNDDLILINLIALVVGGVVSYWFAGRTLQPIEESHESQKRFAADASHELRTPLTNLRLENEVFLRQKDFNAKEAKGLIESNLEEVQRLENLAGSLLALTQYDNASLTLTSLEAKELVDTALGSVSKVAETKKIKFETEIKHSSVKGQKESLVQLLCIVLDNAIKYSPKEGKVQLKGNRRGNRYIITIVDKGPGIDEADLPFIFDRLYRGDKARSKSGGYGLGLSLAKLIAEANNASIHAENHPEGGALFVISLESK